MNEVKPSDIKLVTDAFRQYINHVAKTKNVNLQEFFNFMEPIFIQAGYRTPVKGGGQQSILLLTGDGVGDFILMSPAIREIRRIYPDAHITLGVNINAFNVAETCPYVDEILIKYQGVLFAEPTLAVMPQLLKRRYDIAFSFKDFKDFSLLMYLSGAKSRIIHSSFNEKELDVYRNIDLYFQKLATNRVPLLKYGTHALDIFLSVVDDTLHLPVSNRELEVWYTPAEFTNAENFVSNLPRPLYALVPGASSPRRRYPPEKYAELVKLILVEEPTATFINLGGGQYDLYAAQILRQSLGEEISSKHVVNLVNQCNYRQSAAIMKCCDMYIGNNTGNKDIAMAVKCPLLVAECFPKDLDSGVADIPRSYGPYKVPAVSVQPAHALPECAVNEPYHPYGCRAEMPHCITQIEPQILFQGYKILKDKIAKNIVDTTYIS